MTAEDDDPPDPVSVPPDALPADVLRRVIESFVLREGTEYGAHDVPLEDKVADVRRQLERGEATIVFDPASESVDIVASGRRGPARR